MAVDFVESLLRDRSKRLTILGIGAHPDDCEFRMGGTAAKLADLGHRLVFLSLTNGQSGHFREAGAALVTRRSEEARAAAAVIGALSIVLPVADGHLDARLEYRYQLIRTIREVAPDLIFTNRPNDYHPDHRYTAQLVQDSAYMLRVPHVVPEAQAMDHDPIILYWYDHFQKPIPFRPQIVVEIDSVLERKIGMLARHRSQFYEWLPWVEGIADDVPEGEAERLPWLQGYYESRRRPRISDLYREILAARYGKATGASVVEAEAFELCEYGAQPTPEQLAQLFSEV